MPLDRVHPGAAVRTAALIALLCTALAACGRKAPPRPPEDVAPQPIADLRVANIADGVQLAWSRPRLYADGTRMNDLGGFVVERALGADPLAPFQRVTELKVDDRERFRQTPQFRYIDGRTNVGTAYRYRVVSFTTDGYVSAPSNVVTIERSMPSEEPHASLSPTPG